MKITIEEYRKLANELNDDDFKLLTIMILHPEMQLKELLRWFDGSFEKKYYKNKKGLTIEGLRKRIISINWKIEKIRGNNIGIKEYYRQYLQQRKKEKEEREKLVKKMIRRWKKYIKQGKSNSEAIKQILNEFDYPMSYKVFHAVLQKKFGLDYVSRYIEKLYSEKEFANC